MSKCLFILSLLISCHVFGQVQVQQINPEFNVNKMKSENVIVHKASSMEKSVLIAKPQRDRIFEKANIILNIKNMDEIAKDTLVIRVQSQSVGTLAKKYPSISKSKFKLLKKLISGARNE